jgi:hypothetical protein
MQVRLGQTVHPGEFLVAGGSSVYCPVCLFEKTEEIRRSLNAGAFGA